MADPFARSLAVVTGGGSGIGLAVARELAARGSALVLAGRDGARLDRAARELGERPGGPPVVAQSCDVTRADDVVALVASAERVAAESGRRIDLVVSNAGAVEVHGVLDAPVDEDGHDVYDRMLDVCFLGAVRVAEAFLPGLVARGRGLVVQTASAAALRAFDGIAAYSVAKHALLGWSRAAALELAPRGVGVAVLCPYYVRGEMLERASAALAADAGLHIDAARALFASRNPGGALVEPEQIAGTTAELFERALVESPGPGARVVVLDGGPARPPDPAIDRTP
ncbi:putative oxidoreductase [Planctomycetes bacterium Pla163]|uniref:Putative oxidoreductase n=1 Tax=Rohdeia mirabilis TaxID=2528008 RepID=A0A518CY91_9BACT|nr:putative oxidoreductase [Planctomycetes bacterium Pla163]